MGWYLVMSYMCCQVLYIFSCRIDSTAPPKYDKWIMIRASLLHFTFTSTVLAHGERSYLYKSYLLYSIRVLRCVALCLQKILNMHSIKIETHHSLTNEELQRRIKAAVSARPCLCCHSKPGFQRLRNKIMLHVDGHVTKDLLPYTHIMQI